MYYSYLLPRILHHHHRSGIVHVRSEKPALGAKEGAHLRQGGGGDAVGDLHRVVAVAEGVRAEASGRDAELRAVGVREVDRHVVERIAGALDGERDLPHDAPVLVLRREAADVVRALDLQLPHLPQRQPVEEPSARDAAQERGLRAGGDELEDAHRAASPEDGVAVGRDGDGDAVLAAGHPIGRPVRADDGHAHVVARPVETAEDVVAREAARCLARHQGVGECHALLRGIDLVWHAHLEEWGHGVGFVAAEITQAIDDGLLVVILRLAGEEALEHILEVGVPENADTEVPIPAAPPVRRPRLHVLHRLVFRPDVDVGVGAERR